MAEHEAASAAFPTDPSEFDSDDRISFSKVDRKFLLVQEDGSEYEFDEAIKRWIPVLDEALMEEQQRAYRVSGVDENAPVEATRKKRKAEYVNGEEVSPWCHWDPRALFHRCLYFLGKRAKEIQTTPGAPSQYGCICDRSTLRCNY